MFKDNILVFDIETVADVAGYRRLHALKGGSAAEVAQLMASERLADSGTSFLRPHLHRIVAISVLLNEPQRGIRLWSLGDEHSDEAELVRRFFAGIDRFVPNLVSWNGGNFDLPVLHYRAMRHGISARQYFETGEHNPKFRFNNYLSRYHWRHTDLMDVLAFYNNGNAVKLDELAKLCGFPGKLAMDGSAVQERFERGEIEAIRNYCETDVLNTYLLYLRFELLRGNLNQLQYEAQLEQVKSYLRQDGAPDHWHDFLEAWQANEA